MKTRINWRVVVLWLAMIAFVAAAAFQLVPGAYSLVYLLLILGIGALVLSMDGDDR